MDRELSIFVAGATIGWRGVRAIGLLAAIAVASACSGVGRAAHSSTPLMSLEGEWEHAPRGVESTRVSYVELVPPEASAIPTWTRRQFGVRRPATTWRPSDQPVAPVRWDAVRLGSDGRPSPGAERYTVFHGNGCCGGCQTVAMLGAVLMQHRIDRRSPVPGTTATPHRADIPPLDDELDLRTILGTSRQAYITGGRPIPEVAPAIATVGAALRSRLGPALAGADPWLPAPLCQALAGRGLPVLRARVRRLDVRYMTVALQQGPVVISGAFNRLERGADGIYRCPGEPPDQRRHHFMLVVGWELDDTNADGTPDEVVWLTRDDGDHHGGDRDTWADPFGDDEWLRIVPRGCLLDEGNAYSVIPGTVVEGTFDDPIVPGTVDRPVSYCEADPDGDGVPTARDLCPFTADPAQADRDGDGVGDACDPCPAAAPVRRPQRGHRDVDEDRIADECDPCPEDPDAECRAPAAR